MEAPRVGQRDARRPEPGDGRCVDLRPGPGGAEPDPLRAEVLSARDRHERRMNAPAALAELLPQTVEFTARRPHRPGLRRRDHPEGRRARTASTSRTSATRTATGPTATAAPAWSRSTGERTLAPSCCRAVTAGMEVQATSERALKSQKMVRRDAAVRHAGRRATSGSATTPRCQHGELSDWAAQLGVDGAARTAGAAPRAAGAPTSRTRRWRSTSTPASSATAACAPAAKSRSTT